MKVIYHSALVEKELEENGVFYAIPGKAYLTIEKERGDQCCEILHNGKVIDPNTKSIDIDAETELLICGQNEEKKRYLVKSLTRELSNEYVKIYDQFQYEYSKKPNNEIDSIKTGHLKMYAVEQGAEVYDWTDIFSKIENAYQAIKTICEKPKSHLKAINEVCPIETVKRVGYESIPYLAAHSEDWLARTASGLKPTRLFSRVEDDEYHIYENRVVKTLIDLILSFLRKKEKELKDKHEQMCGIINSTVQTGSFGFDVSFQKAVAELIGSDNKGDEYRSIAVELAEKLHDKARQLLKEYRALRSTRLYRYLKKTKMVSNPLNETNIMLMDKHYNVVFVLWKELHKIIAPRQSLEEQIANKNSAYDNYLLFCKTLCGYAAHTLNFEIEKDGSYLRKEDNLEISIAEDAGQIILTISDKTKRTLKVSNGLQIPIAPGNSYNNFSYNGTELLWENDVSNDEIDEFCSLFKTRESRKKEQADEQKRYHAIKQAIDQRQREYSNLRAIKAIICPAIVELENETRTAFREFASSCAKLIAKEKSADYVIIALPKCDEDEQAIIDYAKYKEEKTLILPLTMIDINSFRRLQNVLLRMILKFESGLCPSCGKVGRKYDNQYVCDSCYNLVLTKTVCPSANCKRTYFYLGYDTTDEVLSKMQNVDEDNFYQNDGLYQYKDIVPLNIESGKLKPICPYCGK